jgi:hypothetical protein
MKFSINAIVLLSSILAVRASVYKVKFESKEIAENCLQINAAYLNKVSSEQYVTGNQLTLVNQVACDPVIETEISDVCGSVVSSKCFSKYK